MLPSSRNTSFKLHLSVLGFTLVSEWIGVRELRLGPGVILLLPLLYGFALGALFNPSVSPLGRAVYRELDLEAAREMIVVAILPFVARFGTIIGPAFRELAAAGPALVLQELGNLATVLVALPVAVLVLGMGREAIGATYSIAREPNIAIISDRYGLSGPEGTGVMSIYALGTLFGTLVFAVMASFLASIGALHPSSLAMACGVGSGSMMAACAGALVETVSGSREELLALAGASNLLTYATGLYAGLFLALPMAETLYRWLTRERITSVVPKVRVRRTRPDIALRRSTRHLLIVGSLIWAGNGVASAAPLRQSLEGIALLLGVTLFGLAAAKWAPFYLPGVAWISLAGMVASLPNVPGSSFLLERAGTIDVLPAATPCLVYAGLALTRGEMTTFRKSSWRWIVVAALVFAGTYVGSALVAEGVSRLAGRI